MIVSITPQNYETEVTKSALPVIIDFYADWCGPCKQMMPHFEALASEMSATHKFAKVDVDQAREIAIKHNISSVPTILFFRKGELAGREQGYMSKETLKRKIQTLLS
jgi:thioredoxin 1